MSFYVNSLGEYLGAFEGAEPPEGATQVSTAPADARQIYSSGAWQPLTAAQRAARVVLPRLEFEGVLAAALAAGGAQHAGAAVTVLTVIAYVDAALAASGDLTATEATAARWIMQRAATFHRGDPEIVIAAAEGQSARTAAELLEMSAAVLGFGRPEGSPTWSERVTAAGPAVDVLFVQAIGEAP